MSVRSFHSVFMASAVAGAALGCYLVSLRVASERAALEEVETRIVLAQRDIRLLQTEIGTRARLSQLERWNVRVLSLSAPTADQILGDKFQLARLIAPERKPAVEAPVILATAPALPSQPFGDSSPAEPATAPVAGLLHEASAKVPEKAAPALKPTPAPAKPAQSIVTAAKANGDGKKAKAKEAKSATAAVTRPIRTAKVDPLGPLPTKDPADEAARTDR